MKAILAAAALLALAAGCGGHSSNTRLTIQSGSSAYDLRCDPPGGTVSDPTAVCHALGNDPELLVGGPGIDHSCPAGAGPSRIVGVRGKYRGHPVDAVFSDTQCGWTPGQDGALAEWSGLLAGSGPGRLVATTPSEPTHSVSENAGGLRGELGRLIKQRKASRSTRLDGRALRIIRDQAQLTVFEGGPLVAREDVFRVQRRKLEHLLGFATAEPNGPVIFVVTRYAYRDYARRKHVATDGLSYVIMDARTMDSTDFGLGSVPSLRSLGRPVTLDF